MCTHDEENTDRRETGTQTRVDGARLRSSLV